MIDFKKLEQQYQTDAAFNGMVNLFTQLIEQHGFQPSEVRDGLFFAQWVFETRHPRQIIRTEEDWQKIAEARMLMKDLFAKKVTSE